MVVSRAEAVPDVVFSSSKDHLVLLWGNPMSQEELLALLRRARAVLGHYLFEGEDEPIRDDVAQICIAIDDALPDETRVAVKRVTLERSAA
jgi:hypothetical protein